MILSKEDLDHWMQTRISELHEDLESPCVDERQTQFIRGQIETLRELLNTTEFPQGR